MAVRLRLMDAGDAAFFAWAVGWARHALFSDPGGLPHGNFFHPMRYTLGMDEPVLGTSLLVLPLALFTDDAVLLHNVARLATFALSGLTAYLLARSLGAPEAAALAGGAFFAFSPIRTDQIAHLSTLGTQWLPLTLLFALRFFRDGRRRDALFAAVAFALAAYACGYHAVIAAAVLPVAFLPAVWGRWNRLPAAALAAALAAVLLLPLYRLHQAALDPLGYSRSEQETVVFSAALESFLATSSWNRVWGQATAPFRTTHSNNLFAGLVVIGLAALGARAAWRAWRERRVVDRDALVLALLVLAAAAVALGPEIRAFGHTVGPGPFALARELPVFRMIRVPSRAGPFLALGLAMLAARALGAWRPRLAAVAAGLGLAEALIVPVPMPGWARVVDTRQAPPPVYHWLEGQPRDVVVAEMPMQDITGIHTRPAFHESIYMVRSTRHWRRLVNGYAGIEPSPYVVLRSACRRFPERPCLEGLAAREASLVIVHRRGFGPNQWKRVERQLAESAAGPPPRLREVARFDDDIVFALERS